MHQSHQVKGRPCAGLLPVDLRDLRPLPVMRRHPAHVALVMAAISLTSFDAYNFGRRLTTLKGLIPFEFISKCWTSDPQQKFELNPLQQMPGLNI